MDTMQVGNLDEHSSERSHIKKDGDFLWQGYGSTFYVD